MELTMIQALERALKANKQWTKEQIIETVTPLQSLELKYGDVPKASFLEDAYEYSKYLYVTSKGHFMVSTIIEEPKDGIYNKAIDLGDAASLFSGFDTIAIGADAPKDDNAKLWMPVNEKGEFVDESDLYLVETLDDEISEYDTWSSLKISRELNRFSGVAFLHMFDSIICVGDGQMDGLVEFKDGFGKSALNVPSLLSKIYSHAKVYKACTESVNTLESWKKYFLEDNSEQWAEFIGQTNPIFLLMFGAETYEYDETQLNSFLESYISLLNSLSEKKVVVIVPERANEVVKDRLNNLTFDSNFVIINITNLENGFYHEIDKENLNVKYYNEIGYTKLASQIVDSINALSPKELYKIKPNLITKVEVSE